MSGRGWCDISMRSGTTTTFGNITFTFLVFYIKMLDYSLAMVFF